MNGRVRHTDRTILLHRLALPLIAAGLSLFAQQAETPQSMTELARRYEHGIGCPRDVGRALFWYKRAASEGDPEAMLALGDLYTEGRCVDRDLAYAKSMYRKAAEQGFAPAMVRLAETAPPDERDSLLHRAASAGYGPAMTQLGDITGDESWYRRAADIGHPAAFAKLAARTTDAAESLALLHRGVDRGDPAAKSALGMRLEASDPAEAARLYTESAEAGDPIGMERRAYFAEWGLGGIPKSEGDAVVWYRRAADAGVPRALHWLAVREEKTDPTSARLLYRKAADGAYAPAMTRLAMLTGNQDLLRAAAEAGDPEALFRTGRIEQAADRGHAGALAALGRHEEAAQRGHVQSLVHLGRIEEAATAGHAESAYQHGLALSDAFEGTRWIQRAAESGHAAAMRELGLRYREGRHAPRDATLASRWLKRAADAGDAEALFHIGQVKEAADLGYGPALVAVGDRESLERAAAAGYANAWTKLGDLEKAAELGDPEAKALLAEKASNPREAYRLYREAAEAGYVPAMLRAGDCHLNGRGTSRSELDAVNWYRRAAASGSEEALQKLRTLGKGL